MTDKTTTQNLTRTTSTDDPKLMAGYLATLAKEIDQRMRAHYYDLGRSQYRPCVVISKTIAEVVDTGVSGSSFVRYDTVDVDTGGMADFSVSNLGFTLSEFGWWAVGGYLQNTGFGAVNSDVMLEISQAGYNTVRDGGHAFDPVSLSGIIQVTSPTSIVSQMLNTGSSTTLVTTVQAAQLWAYKVRDL